MSTIDPLRSLKAIVDAQPNVNGSPELLAEYTSLAGSWVLDTAKSSTMEAHLQTLGVPPLAIEAQMKSELDDETRTVIGLDYKRFLVYKKSKITVLAEAYDLDIDRSFPCRSGTRQTVVRLKDNGSLASIIITSSMPTTAGGLQQTDTWKLQENGLVMVQEIRATNLQNCRSCMTVRIWRRVPTLSEDVNTLTTLLQEEKGSVLSP